MAEGQDESSEKTEEPTKKKLDDARKKGQVAKSKELTSFAALITVFGYFCLAYPYFLKDVLRLYDTVFTTANSKYWGQMDLTGLNTIMYGLVGLCLKIVLVPAGLAALISGVMAAVQVGGLQFSPEAIKFDIQKLNIVTNAKNIFSLKTLKKFAKDMIQLAVMFTISYQIVKHDISELLNSAYYSIGVLTTVFFVLLFKLFLILLIAYLLFASLDLFLEKSSFHKEMKMTREEMKKEMKETEVGQEVKQRQKEFAQEILEEEGINGTVQNSTMVLSNPTHYAIVILYDPKTTQLPIILVKAKDKSALTVFRCARKHKVLIVRDVWLTRRLYALGEVGKYVPSSLVAPVADIIGKNMHLLPEHIQKSFAEMTGVARIPV